MFKYPFDIEGAKTLNKKIFATIYYAACITSNEISRAELKK